MNTEQLNSIPSQIEHLTYKLRINFQATICPEEKLAIYIRYPNKILYLKIDNTVIVLSSFHHGSLPVFFHDFPKKGFKF